MSESQLVDIGRVECHLSLDLSMKEFPIKFKCTFGKPPLVVLANSEFSKTFEGAAAAVKVEIVNLRATGFDLKLSVVPGSVPTLRPFGVTWIAVGEPEMIHVSVVPKYKVLTVVYAPPGSKGGSLSSVSYTAGSTMGTTSSSTRTFKETYAISFDVESGSQHNTVTVGGGFTCGRSSDSSETVEIKKSETKAIDLKGSSQKDGVDHDQDLIYLWLGPKIDLGVTPSAITWKFSEDSPIVVQELTVAQLKGKYPIGKETNNLLARYDITPEDFPAILSHNPFASESPNLDPHRFIRLKDLYPYQPPGSPSGPPPTHTDIIKYESTTTLKSGFTNSYDVEFTRGSQFDIPLVKATMKSKGTWTWTDTSSRSTAVGHSESATFVLGGPGKDGQAPLIAVYFDTLYKTFAFVPVTSISLKGSLRDATGAPIPWSEVLVVSNGVTHRTLTSSKGEFFLAGDMSGQLTVEANGVTKTFAPVRAVRTIEFQ